MERRKAIYSHKKWNPGHKDDRGMWVDGHLENINPKCGWVHGFFQMISSETDAGPCAVFEYQDGTVSEVNPVDCIRFEEWDSELGVLKVPRGVRAD